jgi:hypothetical protein
LRHIVSESWGETLFAKEKLTPAGIRCNKRKNGVYSIREFV